METPKTKNVKTPINPDKMDEFLAQFVKKWLRGNNKTHITKPLSQAIMKRSKLKNKANKTQLLTDIRNCKNQRNYVVNLNKNAEFEYFS